MAMRSPRKFPLIDEKLPHFLHGGDYNPDQWRAAPQVWQEDLRLMKLARCNAMSVGIFSWAALEPEEGSFEFGWLDDVLDRLAENGVYALLATPSGARPAWLSARYPEVLRVGANRVRNLHGRRHNHCYTSPVYREKTALINRKLAERYREHPALLIWHVSNEYGGECHCPLCQEAFRLWLRRRYGESLDRLNQAWWTGFWSHTFSDWSQIESPAPHGEDLLHGLNLDWRRFVTDQTVEFFRSEIAPLRELTPGVPVTTNLMGTYSGLNYWKLAPHLDVVSWDSYPTWHGPEPDWVLGSRVAFTHDLNRSLKGGRPFMLMESTPSVTNWQPVAKLKRPGMHLLSSLQAVAHGSDTVQYFQWRKSRGSSEKLHGAVVDHAGHENTRVFRDVAQVGETLARLDSILGSSVRPEVALIYDWENRWALEDAQGPRQRGKDYEPTCHRHHRAFWRLGVPVDVIDMEGHLDGYRLVVAPMLYMVRPGVAERLERFVSGGGTFVATYWSGIVDENDLCFLGGFPGPLRKLLGIWAEEIDALYDGEHNSVVPEGGNSLGLRRRYRADTLCELLHAETASVLARYGADFYAGRPALTENRLGAGRAFTIASRNEDAFLWDFYTALARQLALQPVLRRIPLGRAGTDGVAPGARARGRGAGRALPEGVTAQLRGDGEREFVFLLNFAAAPRRVPLDGRPYRDLLTGETVRAPSLRLGPYGVRVLERPALAGG
jgi:beta-galactosidase